MPSSIAFFDTAARTATPATAGADGTEGVATPRYAQLLSARIDVSAVTDTPSVVFAIQGWDPAAQEWFDLIVSAAVTGTGVTFLHVGNSAVNTANVSANFALPARVRVRATHADADSITYSVALFFS
jgi:hypothetical protein